MFGWASVLSLELWFTPSRSKQARSLRLFATQATSHPALIPQKVAPRPAPAIPEDNGREDPLTSGIPLAPA